jgi:hypothetical protein
MDFRNLSRNILFILGEDWHQSGVMGPFTMRRIYEEFSDIPGEHVTSAIMSLQAEGSLKVHDGAQRISLTPKGIFKVESLKNSLNELSENSERTSGVC